MSREPRIGLNLVYLVPGETGGMETYARELIPALVEARPALELVAFINEEAAEAGGGPWNELIEHVVVPVRARRRVEWVRGEQQLLPRLCRRHRIDLLHSLASTAPIWGRFVRVVTVHDVIYRIYPEAHGRVLATGMRVLVPLAARRSRRVIAPSKCTRDDLVRLLGVPPSKIDVVPEGVGVEGRVEATSEAAMRSQLGLGTRTVALTLSAKRPHKNLPRLIEALGLIPVAERPILVVPGYSTAHGGELQLRAAALGIESDVRFLGWVSQEDLEGLYSLAACFVFPSLYEGFGLPVLEAMSRGVPVACSTRGSLAEVAGAAARLFDPEQPRSIAEAIQAVLADGNEAERLRQAGRVQAARFSWAEAARGTLRTYDLALGRVSPT